MRKNNWFLMIAIFFGFEAMGANRIITLNPMVAEWTAEIIGIEETQKRLIASSEYSNYPEILKKIPTIGPYPNIQIEKIVSLKPDLVIGSSEYNRPDQMALLKKLGLKVEILPKESFLKMGEWINALGSALGESDQAAKAVKNWELGLKKLVSGGTRKKVFFLVQNQPLITVGSDSFINDVFDRIGYENIFKEISQSYPKVSKEAVLEKKPAEIFVFEMVKDQDDLRKVEQSWKKFKIRTLNGDDFSRCSMRLLKATEMMVHE